MGSFNVGCGISNLSIGPNDEVGYVILNSSTPGQRVDFLGPLFIYNTDLFKPVFPPVFGRYGDYGRIENVKESVTTKVIENIYHLPIEKVMECISGSESAYGRNSAIFSNLFAKEKNFDEIFSTIEEQLVYLGFTKTVETNIGEVSLNVSKPIHKIVYTLGKTSVIPKKEDQWCFRSTNRRVRVSEDKTVFATGIHSLMNEFSSVTGVFPGFNPDDYAAIKKLTTATGMFFLKDVFDSMVAKRNDYSWWDVAEGEAEEKENLNKWIQKLKDPNQTTFGFSRLESNVDRNTAFPKDSYKELVAYENSDEFSMISQLSGVMYSVNRMYMPSFNGEQDGNTKASMALNEISKTILESRVYDEDEDE